MATDVDPLQTVIDLIAANYDNTNTDNKQYDILDKIYKRPANKDPSPGKDLIYVYEFSDTEQGSVGMGNNAVARISEFIRIDVRVRPQGTSPTNKVDDSHARKVRAEINRIIYSNITTPGTGFTIINPGSRIKDLSNGMRGLFRYVFEIELVAECRDLTA